MNNINEPKWLDNAVFYEIYPQSFNDTNADGIGDINGITEKLDYIKDLGCNAIWINPCFKSPFGDAGYDVEDYYMVASRYGTNEDLANLFKEAHKRDMHILLDLVPGHTSVQHEWFKQSMKAEKMSLRIDMYGLTAFGKSHREWDASEEFQTETVHVRSTFSRTSRHLIMDIISLSVRGSSLWMMRDQKPHLKQ